MNAHQRDTSFWRHIIPFDHSDERPKLLKRIAQILGRRKKSNRSQEECRQLVKGLLESHLRKPHIVSLSGSHPESNAPDALEGAAKASGYHANLDSPSWTSNRMCG
jgi:hypothetical protein